MIQVLDRSRPFQRSQSELRTNAMMKNLRFRVFQNCEQVERLHVIFLDHDRSLLSEITFDSTNSWELSLRMRDLFSKALAVGSRLMIIAHNHPSGNCRPSMIDIQTTLRLAAVAKSLDIDLVDHLIFTNKEVYSMRAGGDL